MKWVAVATATAFGLGGAALLLLRQYLPAGWAQGLSLLIAGVVMLAGGFAGAPKRRAIPQEPGVASAPQPQRASA